MSFSRNRTDRCIAEDLYRRRRDPVPQVGMESVARSEVHFAAEQSGQVISQVHEPDKSETLIIHISEQVDVGFVPGVIPCGRAIEVKRGHAARTNGVGVCAKRLDDKVAAHGPYYHKVGREELAGKVRRCGKWRLRDPLSSQPSPLTAPTAAVQIGPHPNAHPGENDAISPLAVSTRPVRREKKGLWPAIVRRSHHAHRL